MTNKSSKGTALITGASSGIGAVYADRLAGRGYDLILVARNRERLDSLAARLSMETGQTIEVVAADLGNGEGIARVEEILRTDASITMLVNNAGVGATAPLLQSDPAKMDAMITLNVVALSRLAKAVGPKFVERGAGTIINISSIAAISPEILNGVYGGTKAFVLTFSQSLHHELADKGVRIQVVLPGATSTEFWDIAGVPVSNLPESIVMSAADMVDAALAGLDQGELVTIPALPDVADWNTFETARQALGPNLSHRQPAERLSRL
ncbi:SDR family oxidoreductase [Phyllobacterium sp. LjRoot231]|uniref:SDR family NAD(P)-dependent oxidoreductase n=1 Tax=Phyllobacterium sp. LjRoot231 TaxID=3342289 RepID=UPI003ECE6432